MYAVACIELLRSAIFFICIVYGFVFWLLCCLRTRIQLLFLFGRLLFSLSYGLFTFTALPLHILALLFDARFEVLQAFLQSMLIIATNAQRFEVLRVECQQRTSLDIVLLENGYIALQFNAHQPVSHLFLGPFMNGATFVIVAGSGRFAIRET